MLAEAEQQSKVARSGTTEIGHTALRWNDPWSTVLNKSTCYWWGRNKRDIKYDRKGSLGKSAPTAPGQHELRTESIGTLKTNGISCESQLKHPTWKETHLMEKKKFSINTL